MFDLFTNSWRNTLTNGLQVKEGGYRRTIFDVWQVYEGIAMHFNDLIIQLRIRALGGVGIVLTLVSFFVKNENANRVDAPVFLWGTLVVVFTLLFMVWLSIWLLDDRYYSRLLDGAVKAIIELEEKTERSGTGIKGVETLNMSRYIEEKVVSPNGRRWFYGVVSFALGTGWGICFIHYLIQEGVLCI